DVVPHQLVRASDDRLYAFAGGSQYLSTVKAYWTSATGLPATSAAFDSQTSVTAASDVLTLDAAYDGLTTIHVLVYANNGSLTDYPFDITTRTFKAGRSLATGLPTVSGDYIGTSGVSGMVDQLGQLNVVHWA